MRNSSCVSYFFTFHLLCVMSSVDWVKSTINSTDTLVIMNKTDLWKETQSLPSVSTIGVCAHSLFSQEGPCAFVHILHRELQCVGCLARLRME